MKNKVKETIKRALAGMMVGVMGLGLVFTNVSGNAHVQASSTDTQMDGYVRANPPELSKDQWTKVGDVWKKIVYFELLDFEKKNVGDKITIASGAGQGSLMPPAGTIGGSKAFEGEIISVGGSNKALKINLLEGFGKLYSKFDLSTVSADYYELNIKTGALVEKTTTEVSIGNAGAYMWQNEGKIAYYKGDGTLVSEEEGSPAKFRVLPIAATSGSSVDGIIGGIKATPKTEVSLTINIPGNNSNNYYIDQLQFVAVVKTDPNPTPPDPEEPADDPYPVGINEWKKSTVDNKWRKKVTVPMFEFEAANYPYENQTTLPTKMWTDAGLVANTTLYDRVGPTPVQTIDYGTAGNKALKAVLAKNSNIYGIVDLVALGAEGDSFELRAEYEKASGKMTDLKLMKADADDWLGGTYEYRGADGQKLTEGEITTGVNKGKPIITLANKDKLDSETKIKGAICGITEKKFVVRVQAGAGIDAKFDKIEIVAVKDTNPNPEEPADDPYPVGINEWKKSTVDNKWRKKVTVPMFEFEAANYPYKDQTTLPTKMWTDAGLVVNTTLYDRVGPTPVQTIDYGTAGNKALEAVLAKNSNIYGIVDLDALGAEGDSFELRAEYEKASGKMTDLKLMKADADDWLGGTYEYRGADGQKLTDGEITTGVNKGKPIITLANKDKLDNETKIKGAICGITEKKFVVRVQAGAGIDAKFDKIEIVAVKDTNPNPPIDPDPDPDPSVPKYPVGIDSWLKGEDNKFRKKVVVPIFDIQSPDYFAGKYFLNSSKFPELSQFISNTTLYEKDNDTTVGLVNVGDKKALEIIPTVAAKQSNVFALVDLSSQSADSYEIDVDYIKSAAKPDTIVKLLNPNSLVQPLSGTFTYLDATGERIKNADNTILEKSDPVIQLAGGVSTNTVTEVKGRICGITSNKFLVNIASETGSQGIKVRNIELIAVKNVDPSGGGNTGGSTGGGSSSGGGGGVPNIDSTTKPSENAIPLDSIENITKAVNEIKTAEPKDRLVVDMTAGNTKVPVELLSAAKGKDVTLQFEQNGIIAYVNGKSISELSSDIKAYDIKITKSNNIEGAKLEEGYVVEQLNCAYEGKLPFVVKTKSAVDKNQIGKMLYYNYYNEELDRYEYQSVDDVDSNGVLYGELNYGGKYIISSTPGYVPVKMESMSGTTDQRVNAKNNVVLKLAISPGDYTVKRIQWKVSDPSYATVGNNGVVRATKEGKGKEITVTASALDGSGLTKTFNVNLTPKKK